MTTDKVSIYEAKEYLKDRDEVTKHILNNVLITRIRQLTKFGIQNHDDFTWFAILSEEIGEVAKEIVDNNFTKSVQERHTTHESMKYEIIDCIAVCVSWLDNIEKRTLAEIDNEGYKT